jgi:hypothetical protein
VATHVGSFAVTAAVCVIIGYFQNTALNLRDTLQGFSVSFLVFSLIIALETPVFFKMGYLKGRGLFIFFFVLVLALALSPAFFSGLMEWFSPLLSNYWLTVFMGILLAVLALYISCQISVAVYLKKK